jgi:FAD/FMN-containing dehydrogenase
MIGRPPDSELEHLAKRLHGALLLPGYPGYDEARRVWNRMIDRYPAVIVMCASRADVIEAVRYARVHGIEVAIRCGGHNVSGRSVCDAGMVIDLSRMKYITINPIARTATAGPGLTWGEFDASTATFGLATTGGLVSTTGIAGLTLGGGVGWLMRQCGLSCDNLVSAEVITADGEAVSASADSDESLLWALRGGGGNFGVVTRLEYRLHAIHMVTGGLLVYPLSAAGSVLRFYRDALHEAPDALTTFVNFITLTDGTKAVALAVCCLRSGQEGESLLGPLRRLGGCISDTVGEMPYQQLQTIFDAGCPAGRYNYWRSSYLRELSDAAIEVMIDFFGRVTSPHTTVDIEPFGGAVGRRSPIETAFPHRGAQVNLLICSMWLPDEDDAPHIEWTREYWRAMQPYMDSHVYVNYLDGTTGQTAHAAYGPNLARLAQVKARYDPENFFHLNHNVLPYSSSTH